MLARKQRRGRLVSARQEIAEQTRIRNNYERALFNSLMRAFRKIGRRAADQYIEGGETAVNGDLIYVDISDAMNGVLRQLMMAMTERFQTVRQKASQFDNIINEYIRSVAGTRIQIARHTYDIIMREISKGVEAGEGPEAVGKRIFERTGGSIGRARASTIARTESHSAAGFANHAVARSLDTPLLKRWVSTNDDRTRSAHRKLNGQEVGLDDVFTIEIDGVVYRMSYAGDPAGGAVNTINCRCVIVYVEPDDVIIDETTPRVTDRPAPVDKPNINIVGLITGRVSAKAKQEMSKQLNDELSPLTATVASRLPEPRTIVRGKGWYNALYQDISTPTNREAIESRVISHEYGHHIDYQLGNREKLFAWSEKSEDFREAFLTDAKAVMSSMKVDDIIKDLFESVTEQEIITKGRYAGVVKTIKRNKQKFNGGSNISDIFDAIYGGRVYSQGAFGHGTRYFGTYSAKAKETFANLYALHGDELGWKKAQQYFPNLCRVFEDKLKEVAGGT